MGDFWVEGFLDFLFLLLLWFGAGGDLAELCVFLFDDDSLIVLVADVAIGP